MKNVFEQVAHFVLSAIFGYAIGPLTLAAIMVREFSNWKLPWPMKGQWPPGKPTVGYPSHTQMDRVEDLRTDMIWQTAGYAVGQTAQLIVPWWGFL